MNRLQVLRIAFVLAIASVQAADLESRVQHGYADSNGVKIHYATVGQGPLVLMIHGFPDYWYSWRHQWRRSPTLSGCGDRSAGL